MESQSEFSDTSDSKLNNTTSEELSPLDLPFNTSSDLFPITSSEIPLSSQEDSEDTLLNSSSDLPLSLFDAERSSSRSSSQESSLAHPLGSWSESQSDGVKDTVLIELSELPLSDMPLSDLVDYDSDCSFQDEVSQEANSEVVTQKRKGKSTREKGFFQPNKFDVLNAMKAEVCKVSGVRASETTDTETPNVTLKVGNEEIKDENTEHTESSKDREVKVTEEMGIKASEDTETKAREDFDAKVTEVIKTKANRDTEFTVCEHKETEASDNIEDIYTEGTEEIVNEDFKLTKTCDMVSSDLKATVTEPIQIEVPSTKICNGVEKDVTYVTSSAKCDILDAMKSNLKGTPNGIAHVDSEARSFGAIDNSLTKDLIEESGKRLDDTKDNVKETSNGKVCENIEASTPHALNINVMEKLIKENGISVTDRKTVEHKVTEHVEMEVSEAVEDNVSKHTLTEVSEAVEDKVGQNVETEVSEAVEDNVGKDMETEVSEAVKDNVSKNMEAELSEVVEDNISKNMEIEVSEAVEDNLIKGMEKIEPKIDEAERDKIVKAGNPSGVTCEASAVSEAQPSEILESNNDTKPGTSKSTEAKASKRSIEEEEDQIEFECNDDGQGETDSILLEEALRLDQLNLPSQVTPEPDIPVGEGEREVQYRKLVDLLSKSKFYTDVLLRKVEADIVKYSKKRKQLDAASNGSPSKKKKILMENQRAMCQIASEVIKNKQEKTTSVDESADQSQSQSQSTAEVKSSAEIKQPKHLIGGTLRDYQLEGFHWLKVLYENGVNGILADEMGLGKTIQVIALLSHLVQMKIKGPFLIVGPLSTLPNWMIEFKRFAPQLHVVLFYGSKTERKKMSENLRRRKTIDGVLCYPIVVTSYEIPVFERAFMSRLRWKYIIVDEGHKIKNYNTLLAKVLRTFDSANRLLLTGTPLQNSLSELWSLLNFLVPEIFDNLDVFESWFRIEEIADDAGRQKIIEEERRKNVLKTLHQILAPFMLRRVKSEVTLDIPKKKEVIVKAPMTEMQLKLYQALLDKNVVYLKKIQVDDLVIPDVNGKRPKRSCTRGKNYEEKSEPDDIENVTNSDNDKKNDIESIITHFIRVKMQRPWVALKQIANHPYLIHYPLQKDGKTFLVDEGVVKSSGKFLVLDAMLEKLHAKGHKVLIFSTLCMLLDVVEDYLSLRNYSYERLDGTMKIADRADAIQRFNSDPNIFLFLLSTRAGGLGVNLTGADTVIFLDSDWNPQADLQAQDRCHRIGQTKPVMVYSLVTTGTIEEHILKRASAKRVLEKMVICKGTSVQKEFDLEELKSILESRDHSDIVYTDGQVLTDEQLEKLLDRSDLLN